MRISDWSSDVCSSDLNYKFDKIRNRALFGKRSRRNKKEYLKKMREWRASNPVCITCHKPFDEAAEEAVAKAARHPLMPRDRKSVVAGKSVSVRVDLGGHRILKKKKKQI